MRVITMTAGITNNIGRQGENLAAVVTFDLSEFVSTYGTGTPQLLVLRPGDRYPYPVALTVEGNTASWTVTNTDTMISGTGNAELRWYVDNNTLAKSVLYSTQISKALVDPIAPPPPPPADNWLEQVLEAGSAAQAAQAEAAQAASDAQTAQTGAETAQTAAEAAQSGAQAAQTGAETAATAAQAAQQAIGDMTVSSQTGAAGTAPSVRKTVDAETGAVDLEFTLPATLTKSSELVNDADFQTGAQVAAAVAGKVSAAQGTENAGKYLAVDSDGDVTPQSLPGDLYKIGCDLTAAQVLSGNFNIAANLGTVYNLLTDLVVDNSTVSMFSDNKIGKYGAGTNLVVVMLTEPIYMAVRQPLAPPGTIYYAEAGVTYYERNGDVYTQVTDVVVGETDVTDYYTLAQDATYGFDVLSAPFDTSAFVSAAQGVAHAGEFLVVGSDGNVTTQTLAAWEGGSY